MTRQKKVVINWFRNGLRLHDNNCLHDACTDAEALVPLYVIDKDAPFAQTPGRKAAPVRANFALEAIEDLARKFKKMGNVSHGKKALGQGQMMVVLGAPEKVLPQIVALTNASALYYDIDDAAPAREQDEQVFHSIRKLEDSGDAIDIKGFASHTIHPMDTYITKCKTGKAPKTYGEFTKIFTGMHVEDETPVVSEMPPFVDSTVVEELRNVLGDDNVFIGKVPTLQELGYFAGEDEITIEKFKKRRMKGGLDFTGGEDAGLALLKEMMSRTEWAATFEKPKTRPNALKVDTTGLSPYIKHGCVSAKKFYHELSSVYRKYGSGSSKPPVSLHGQLMWREYNYLMGYSTPNFDKMVGNPIARQIDWDENPEYLDAWVNSKTGYPFIDAIMTQLRQTGWIHHLARHAVACFLTRGDLYLSWEKGAEIFEEHLIDADWSINNFNWQWLSCTAHFYQYFRCYSPIAFGKKTDPNGAYIRKWLPQFKNMPSKFIYEPWTAPKAIQKQSGIIIGETYPAPIVEHKTISKWNMARIKDAYAGHVAQTPMAPQAGAKEKSRKKPSGSVSKPTKKAKRGRITEWVK